MTSILLFFFSLGMLVFTLNLFVGLVKSSIAPASSTRLETTSVQKDTDVVHVNFGANSLANDAILILSEAKQIDQEMLEGADTTLRELINSKKRDALLNRVSTFNSGKSKAQ